MKKLSFSSLLIIAITLILATIIGAKILQFKSMADAAENLVLPAETVSTFTIEKQSWKKSLYAIGTIDSIQGVLLQSEIDGIVRVINFDNGQEVKKGDLLIQLDVSVEKAELKAAKALAHLAELELERAERLQKSGSLPESELDRAFAEAASRNAGVENIEARIARKTLYAPFTGIVGIRQVNLGQYIASGTEIVSLQKNESVYVNFSLPQNDISNVNNGYEIKLTSDAYPQQIFEGELTAISPEIDPQTRSFSLQGTFKNSDSLLKPGLFVRVEISLPGRDEVVVIPSTAVIYAPYGNSVYKIEESENGTIARQHFITTGRQKGDFISITKGAKVGDIVVSSGAFKLRNGISVRVNNDIAPEPELIPVPSNS